MELPTKLGEFLQKKNWNNLKVRRCKTFSDTEALCTDPGTLRDSYPNNLDLYRTDVGVCSGFMGSANIYAYFKFPHG